MKGVIIAAGFGKRLRPMTHATAKALIEVGDRPLIDYSIGALRSAGVDGIAVIVGYKADDVRSTLKKQHPDITFCYNGQFEGGNALSVLAAKDFVGQDSFVLCMADHVISPDIPHRLLSYDRQGCFLCVDTEASEESQVNDATKVLVDRWSYIRRIGKDLTTWNAVDTGVFLMTPEVFEAIEELISQIGFDLTISDVVEYMGRRGRPFSTCDVAGMFWADVDTLEDYRSVEGLLKERDGERI